MPPGAPTKRGGIRCTGSRHTRRGLAALAFFGALAVRLGRSPWLGRLRAQDAIALRLVAEGKLVPTDAPTVDADGDADAEIADTDADIADTEAEADADVGLADLSDGRGPGGCRAAGRRRARGRRRGAGRRRTCGTWGRVCRIRRRRARHDAAEPEPGSQEDDSFNPTTQDEPAPD